MGEDICDLKDTDLHDAVRYGDIDEVCLALQHGLDPNQIGMYEWTPLHEAASNGDVEILERLLGHGGNPNKKDLLKGFTAIHYAAKNGHEECLRQLVINGGRFNVLSNSGESCFEVATKECLKILQDREIKSIIEANDQLSEGTLDEHVAIETQQKTRIHPTLGEEDEIFAVREPPNASPKSVWIRDLGKSPDEEPKIKSIIEANDQLSEGTLDEHVAIETQQKTRIHPTLGEEDEIFAVREPPNASPKSVWIRDLGKSPDEEPIAGFLQLSFEFNSKKSTLKIRVWQVSEILLPPVETSMFNAVYVKSYLQPDAKHQTKRRTEFIKLDNPELPITKAHYKSKSHDKEISLHAVFQPMTFKFSKPLDYEKVSKEMVAKRTVEIVVCVIQKYTRKSFMIAKLLLPLKDAVRKLVRENVPLKPCLQTNIQEKVRPYPKDVLKVMSNYRLFGGSNPNIRVSPLFLPEEVKAASDTDLKNVVVGSPSKAVVLSVPTEDPSDTDSLKSISVEEFKMGSTFSILIGEQPSESRFETSPHDSRLSLSPTEKIREKLPKKEIPVPKINFVIKGHKDVEEGQGSKVKDSLASAEEGVLTKFDTVEELYLKPKHLSHHSWISPSSSRPDSPVSYLTSISRPDTPTWDAYMQPLEITGEIPLDAREEDYHPPMAISMNLPQILHSFQPIDFQNTDAIATLPGQAEVVNENSSIIYQGRQKSTGKKSSIAISKDDPCNHEIPISKQTVPVMGARASEKNTGYKMSNYELQPVRLGEKVGACPGRVPYVDQGDTKMSHEFETSFVTLMEKSCNQTAIGKKVQEQYISDGDSRRIETSFTDQGQADCDVSEESLLSRAPKSAVHTTQLLHSLKGSQGPTDVFQRTNPEKPKFDFGEESLTIIETSMTINAQQGAREKSPNEPNPKAKLRPFHLVTSHLTATKPNSQGVDRSAGSLCQTETIDGATEIRPVNPRNMNEISTAMLKNLTLEGPKSPTSLRLVRPIIGDISKSPESLPISMPTTMSNLKVNSPISSASFKISGRSQSSTSQRPTSPSVNVAKEFLKQKLLLKKQQISKQSDQELFVLGDSVTRPGSAKVVHSLPVDLESDV